MTDRPIIFSAPMIRALLEGQKTQTRRILKPKKGVTIADFEQSEPHASGIGNWMRLGRDMVQNPRFAVGDRLWVRETCGLWMMRDGQLISPPDGDGPVYRATEPDEHWRAMLSDQKTLRDMNCGRTGRFSGNWAVRTSIHMPRWASRLTLIVESVKVERLQAMNRGDAMEEGCPFPNMANRENPIDWFRALWTVIHGAGSWDANPFVAAISFRVVKANIDTLANKSP
jgi:hypothetical protein